MRVDGHVIGLVLGEPVIGAIHSGSQGNLPGDAVGGECIGRHVTQLVAAFVRVAVIDVGRIEARGVE
jgi:hypothetical protein